MNNKSVLITGGSQGIGFAAGVALGELGYTVVLLGHTRESGMAAAGQLQEMNIDAVGDGANVGDAQEMNELASRLGPLAEPDVLVISAGVMSARMSKTLRTTSEEWSRVMSTNLDGAFNAIRLFTSGMVSRRDGRVVSVSACLGRFSGPGTSGGLAPYRVSKAGLNALTRNFAAETNWGERGVLVDAMCPNHCRTNMGGPDAARSAQEGAETIVWLATSDLAQRHTQVNGSDAALTGLLWEDRAIVPW